MSRTVTIYCLDVSEGMAEKVPDPTTGVEIAKIELAKEYIQRKIAPKVRHDVIFRFQWLIDHDSQIQSGRKTEYAGVITFGGG